VVTEQQLQLLMAVGVFISYLRLLPAIESLGFKYVYLPADTLCCPARLTSRWYACSFRYSSVLDTLRVAAPFLMRFLFGALIVFVGFCFFATTAFSRYSLKLMNFGELLLVFVPSYTPNDLGIAWFLSACADETSMLLFSVMNGDSIYDSFDSLSNTQFWVFVSHCSC